MPEKKVKEKGKQWLTKNNRITNSCIYSRVKIVCMNWRCYGDFFSDSLTLYRKRQAKRLTLKLSKESKAEREKTITMFEYNKRLTNQFDSCLINKTNKHTGERERERERERQQKKIKFCFQALRKNLRSSSKYFHEKTSFFVFL